MLDEDCCNKKKLGHAPPEHIFNKNVCRIRIEKHEFIFVQKYYFKNLIQFFFSFKSLI